MRVVVGANLGPVDGCVRAVLGSVRGCVDAGIDRTRRRFARSVVTGRRCLAGQTDAVDAEACRAVLTGNRLLRALTIDADEARRAAHRVARKCRRDPALKATAGSSVVEIERAP